MRSSALTPIAGAKDDDGIAWLHGGNRHDIGAVAAHPRQIAGEKVDQRRPIVFPAGANAGGK